MDTVNNILKRRSIRRYKSEQIPADTLKEIINCGINAPSALNMQPWQIRVIRSQDMLQRLNGSFVDWARGKSLPGSASRAGEEGFSVFHNAPTLLIVAPIHRTIMQRAIAVCLRKTYCSQPIA